MLESGWKFTLVTKFAMAVLLAGTAVSAKADQLYTFSGTSGSVNGTPFTITLDSPGPVNPTAVNNLLTPVDNGHLTFGITPSSYVSLEYISGSDYLYIADGGSPIFPSTHTQSYDQSYGGVFNGVSITAPPGQAFIFTTPDAYSTYQFLYGDTFAAVPEPCSIGLAGGAMMMLLARRSRRAR